MLEDHRDVIEGLNDTANTLTTYRLNEVMKILTIISVIMLPLTLVSGIYGMNLELPLDESSPYSFVIILVLMVFLAGGMMLYFKRKRWI
jgi:magnesium transporter